MVEEHAAVAPQGVKGHPVEQPVGHDDDLGALAPGGTSPHLVREQLAEGSEAGIGAACCGRDRPTGSASRACSRQGERPAPRGVERIEIGSDCVEPTHPGMEPQVGAVADEQPDVAPIDLEQ